MSDVGNLKLFLHLAAFLLFLYTEIPESNNDRSIQENENCVRGAKDNSLEKRERRKWSYYLLGRVSG